MELNNRRTAVKFVVLLGVISLLSDMTYEGARSINGAYLAVLGASATLVGFTAGFGELLGYALRLISGYLADRTAHYWTITIVGYVINLLAVPALALTGHWPTAATLMILERVGKAIRTPARDAMLSYAGHSIGMGWGFGLHEAMDQIGAMLGPLIVAAILYFKGGYHESYAILLIPAVLALLILVVARYLYPRPRELEAISTTINARGLPDAFWLYLTGAALLAAGFADFPLIAYHFEKVGLTTHVWIPVAYAIAMGVDGLVAPLLGYLYDRHGFKVVIGVTLVGAFFAPCAFLGGPVLAFIGVVLWGVGMGSQESLVRAVVGNMAPLNKRGSAYGLFNTGYGIFWFLGSIIMGMLYDKSVLLLALFSLVLQLAAIPWLIMTMRQLTNKQETVL